MVSCSEHDYIEVACLYRYPVKLTMKAGEPVTGIALDTARNEAREECIKINADETEVLVELNGIAKIEALVENKYFTEIVFD